METDLKCQKLKYFTFKYKSISYKINIQKLKEVLKSLNFSFDKKDYLTNDSFKDYLKRHHLLVKEFVEHISDSIS